MKKNLSIILALSMLCGTVSFAEGEEVDWEKYGIDADLSAHKVIKLDGNQYKANSTLTTNYQVMNLVDGIAVFSHPTNSTYKINANALRACELDWTSFSGMTNKTSTGYSLYGVKPDKTSNGEAEMVAGSWLQASDGTNKVFIPVVDSVPLDYYPSGNTGASAILDKAITFSDEAGKAPYKAFDNSASVFTIASGTTVNDATYVPIETIGELNSPKTIVTLTASVYVDGDATAVISYQDPAQPIIKLNGDGSVDYPSGYSYSADAFTHKDSAFTAGAWHTVGITVDYASNRTLVYLDGTLLTKDGWLTQVNGAIINPNMTLGINTGVYTKGGTVAYDNASVDRGYYRIDKHTLNETSSDAVSFANGKITYDCNMPSVDALAEVIQTQTGAKSVRIFTDASMSALATDIDSAKIAEVVSTGGVTEKTYMLTMKDSLSATVDFLEEDGKVAAMATVTNARTTKAYDIIMVMVLRDADGIIQHVYASDQKTVAESQYLQTSLVDKDNCTPEVFFISNWAQPSLMLGKVYK